MEMEMESEIELIQGNLSHRCEICEIDCANQEEYRIHVNSREHKEESKRGLGLSFGLFFDEDTDKEKEENKENR